MKAPIDDVDFGKTAQDYVTHRAGFPDSLFDRLMTLGIGLPGQQILDLGTGTGTLARGFATRGSHVTGIDPAAPMLEAARRLDADQGIQIDYRVGTAEQTGMPDQHFDIVSAGQCWHWFDAARACREIKRLLRPDGQLVVAYYDWLPLTGNVVKMTEALIEQHNPAWRSGNLTGIHPGLFRDLGEGGFQKIESFTYDEPAVYSHASWRGRIRASAGIAATLSLAEVSAFDQSLQQLLASTFPDEPMAVPHRVFVVTAVTAVMTAKSWGTSD